MNDCVKKQPLALEDCEIKHAIRGKMEVMLKGITIVYWIGKLQATH